MAPWFRGVDMWRGVAAWRDLTWRSVAWFCGFVALWRSSVTWRGLALRGVAWRDVARRCVAWRDVARRCVAWRGVPAWLSGRAVPPPCGPAALWLRRLAATDVR